MPDRHKSRPGTDVVMTEQRIHRCFRPTLAMVSVRGERTEPPYECRAILSSITSQNEALTPSV